MELGERVRSLRKTHEMKVEELAVKAGITVGHVYRIERGESQNPKLDVLGGLAAAFGMTIDEMLGR